MKSKHWQRPRFWLSSRWEKLESCEHRKETKGLSFLFVVMIYQQQGLAFTTGSETEEEIEVNVLNWDCATKILARFSNHIRNEAREHFEDTDEHWKVAEQPSSQLGIPPLEVGGHLPDKKKWKTYGLYLYSFHGMLNSTFDVRLKWCSRPEKKRKSSVLDRNWILHDKTMLLNISKNALGQHFVGNTIWR